MVHDRSSPFSLAAQQSPTLINYLMAEGERQQLKQNCRLLMPRRVWIQASARGACCATFVGYQPLKLREDCSREQKP